MLSGCMIDRDLVGLLWVNANETLTLDAIYSRRAVKHFDPNYEFSDAEVEQLMSSAIQSPSSFNMQNWRFVVVRDKDLKQDLRAAAFDQAQVTYASLVIVLTADLPEDVARRPCD